VVVFLAYHPALIFPDSVWYLQYAQHFAAGRWTPDGLRQSGYSVLIIPAVLLHNLWLISLVQHLVGLATGVLVYAVLVRFGVRTWVAAVAAIPVLFDPLELILEQYVLSDTWTVFLLVAALTAGARRRNEQASAALLFTASAVLVLIPPALFATFDWRYQLPQLTLIPVAAVLGGRLITRPRRASGGRARRTRPAAAESGLRVPGAR
jgi:Dolichyl-phosphate-mannose-protein mannosyltransferase